MTEHKKTPPKHSTHVDSREALLQSAKRVFASKGYEGATVKDLADEAGVNVSLVSYHFGGKENLFRTCLESFGMERVEATERILKAPASAEEFRLRLRLFGDELVEIHHREPDICKIIQSAMDLTNAIAMDLFQNVFSRVFFALRDFITAAKSVGLVKDDLDPHITAAMVFGSLMHILRSQHISKQLGETTLEDRAHREKVLDHWMKVVTGGIATMKAEHA